MTKTLIQNAPLTESELLRATQILKQLQADLKQHLHHNIGPFLAAIYDTSGQEIARAYNTVVQDNCSHHHAEMNAIHAAEKAFNTYDLSPYSLTLYTTSEPCQMCLGGILWSGIKTVFFGVPSARVEAVTGFDEGFKPHWIQAFKDRGIRVYGNIASAEGESVLAEYTHMNKIIYSPEKGVKICS